LYPVIIALIRFSRWTTLARSTAATCTITCAKVKFAKNSCNSSIVLLAFVLFVFLVLVLARDLANRMPCREMDLAARGGGEAGQRAGLFFGGVDDESADHRHREAEQQHHDHGAAAGAVPDVARSPKRQQIAHVGDDCRRCVKEISEPSMPRADQPPNHPKRDQHAHRITGPDMNCQGVVVGEERDGERHHQRPVKDPHERIPDINAIVGALVHGMSVRKRAASGCRGHATRT
jgi:hypothetical protein